MATISLSPLLARRLREEKVSAETILRAALNIKTEGYTASEGTHLPQHSLLIGVYKTKAVTATIEDGKIVCEGKPYSTLSAAAAHYTGRPTTNGWNFWLHRLPGTAAFLPIKRAKAA
jgi:hypothetical protein